MLLSDHRGLVPRVPRDGSHDLRRPGGRSAAYSERFVRRPRGRRSPSRHQRALQPRRLADDGVPHGRRPADHRRHVRRRGSDDGRADPGGRGVRGERRALGHRSRDQPGHGRHGRRGVHGRHGAACRRGGARRDRSTRTFDEEHGGFGVEPKFPHTAPVQLALALFRDSRRRAVAARSPNARSTRCGTAGYGTGRRAASPATRQRATGAAARREAARDQRRAARASMPEATTVLGRPADGSGLRLDRPLHHRRRSAMPPVAITAATPTACCTRMATPRRRRRSSGPRRCSAMRDSARDALASFERVLLACYKPGAGARALRRRRGVACADCSATRSRPSARCSTRTSLTGGEPYQMMAEEFGHFSPAISWDAERRRILRSGGATTTSACCGRDGPRLSLNAEAASRWPGLQRISREFDFGPLRRRRPARRGPPGGRRRARSPRTTCWRRGRWDKLPRRTANFCKPLTANCKLTMATIPTTDPLAALTADTARPQRRAARAHHLLGRPLRIARAAVHARSRGR